MACISSSRATYQTFSAVRGAVCVATVRRLPCDTAQDNANLDGLSVRTDKTLARFLIFALISHVHRLLSSQNSTNETKPHRIFIRAWAPAGAKGGCPRKRSGWRGERAGHASGGAFPFRAAPSRNSNQRKEAKQTRRKQQSQSFTNETQPNRILIRAWAPAGAGRGCPRKRSGWREERAGHASGGAFAFRAALSRNNSPNQEQRKKIQS